ncbi:glutathione S-transferase F11-like [Phragmites australis]|uniref:glutathione S-transferase F11-like n=1 Tax=Phragmites australis TaxID=29695 RepID=UPI002D78B914|nr:glutathione S-transferase F11-like [Phragmites australis]
MPVKVFGSPTSAGVARVLACLFEKDVEFQLIRVDSFRGPKRQPNVLKLPWHVEDGDDTFFESRKIVRRIAEKYKNQGYKDLLESDQLDRWSIALQMGSEEHLFDVHSSNMVCSLAYLPPDMPLDGSGRNAGEPPAAGKMEEMLQLFEKSRKELDMLLDWYEMQLGKKDYLAANKFTLADLSHLPNADRLVSDPRSARLIESRKNVSRWWHTISGRDSWKRVKELQRPPSAEAPF